MKWPRRLMFALIALVLLMGGLLLAARFYLSSQAAARRAESALSEALGTPVRIREMDAGLFGSSEGRGIEIFEEGKDTPWVSLERVSTDLSILDLLRGKFAKGTVTVHGAKVCVRFDAQGKLVTRTPKIEAGDGSSGVPTFRLEDSELCVDQQGHEAFVLKGVSGTAHKDGTSWVLDAAVKDPEWGEWVAAGRVDTGPTVATITLKSDRAMLWPERLRKIPFVNSGVWDQVNGQGPARVMVGVSLSDDKVGYRVDLGLLGTAVRVSSIGLETEDTTGNVHVADGLVTLRDLRGKSAEGVIEAKGQLDFRPEPWKFTVTAAAKGVDLQRFTRTWDLPQQLRRVSGKLTGDASLELKIGKELKVTGRGEGRVDDAYFLPQKLGDKPLRIDDFKLRLFYVDGKPRFSSDMSSSRLSSLPGDVVPVSIPLLFVTQEPKSAPDGVKKLLGYPGQAAQWLQRAVESTGDAVLRAGKTVVGAIPRKGGPPREGPTYFEASFGFTDVDLKQLVQQFDVALPFPVEGRGSVRLQVAMPVETPGDVAAYRATGTLTLSRIKLADLELRQVDGRAKLDKGVLRLERLTGQVPDTSMAGTFTGSATFQVAPLGTLKADLDLKNIPVARVTSLVPELSRQSGGFFSGMVRFSAPSNRLDETAAWEVHGNASADRLQLRGYALEKASTKIDLERGQLTLSEVKLGVEGLEAGGSASLTLSSSYPFSARLDLEKADLASLQRLAPTVKIPLDIRGQLTTGAVVNGTLEPFKVNATGKIATEKLKLAAVSFDSFSAGWEMDGETLTLNNLRAGLYKGQVNGSATLPLQSDRAGNIDLKVEGLDVSGLMRDMPGFPVQVSGVLSGRFDGALSEIRRAGERELSSRLTLESARLRIQNIPTERLQAKVGYRRGVVRYRLEGDSLGGRFEVDGRWPSATKRPAGEPDRKELPAPREEAAQPAFPPLHVDTEGTIRIRRALLGRLLRSLTREQDVIPLWGQVDLELNYGPDSKGELQGTGRVAVTRLQMNRVELASRLVGDLRLRGPILFLTDFTGEAAGGGFARLRARYNLRRPELSTVSLDLDRAEASRLLAAFPGLGSIVEGPVDLRLRTTLGNEWRGDGDAVLTRGKVYGLEVAEWRLPFRFVLAPGGGGQFNVEETGAQLGHGRATGRMHADWGGGARLEGHVRFSAVELRSLGKGFLEYEKQFGSARASGRFDFSSRDLRSARDLTGRLEADFRQAKALEMPIFNRLTPFLGGVSSATNFETGKLLATLGQGFWRIQWLGLESRVLRLFADGLISTEGRLDMKVVVRTGEFILNPVLLRTIGLAVGQPLPVEFLIRASEWLSSRVVRLKVGGTLDNPSVRLDTAALLTEGAIRFFFFQAAPGSPAGTSP